MDRLIEAIEEAQNPSVVGLDPTPALVPPQVVDSFTDEVRESIEDESELPAARLAVAYFEFNRAIIDAVADIVPAVKPQIAMYEAIGPAGVDTYTMTCEYAQQQGLYVLGDIKRGDIGSTAAAYAGHLSGVTDGDGLYDPWHEELVAKYDETRREVRRLHMDIYYRPMLPIAALNGEDFSLAPQVAYERFASIGFADPEAAMRHVAVLTAGVSRASKINRILLPAVLQWLGQGQNPDMGLLNWRKLEERFGTDSEYLGFLRDSTSAAQRLCHVLSNSRFLGDALNKSVESVTWLGDDDALVARSRESLDVQCRSSLSRNADGINDFATSMRAMRRHEIERIGLARLSGVMDETACLTGMTDVYDAIIDAALTWAIRYQTSAMGLGEPPAAIAAIGMGRYGGQEVNFSSDADMILLYRPADGADEQVANQFARKVVDALRQVLQGPTTLEPKIEIDLDLRPEGKNGPLIRSYASCREYYSSWANTWEHQALLRARFVAGDRALGEDFLHDIADPLRYPISPLTDAQLGEIRKLKARMEAERLPRGVRRDRHLKLGKGGLSDVEWTVQLLQLQHAGNNASLRLNSTLATLDELERRRFIDRGDAAVLRKAWRMCTAARNGNYLWNGRVSQADILPDDMYSLGGIAVYLGYDAHRGQHFENDLMGTMRKARDVAEHLFYGR